MKNSDNFQEKPTAAVAIIEILPTTQVLIIRRAAYPGDHWSGHFSFPGGKREAKDHSLIATAIRETKEETGIALQEADLAQTLKSSMAGRSRSTPVWVKPFHFQLRKKPQLILDEREVQAAHWLDLATFSTSNRHKMREMLPNRVPGKLYPTWPLGDYYLWGFTYELLHKILNTK